MSKQDEKNEEGESVYPTAEMNDINTENETSPLLKIKKTQEMNTENETSPLLLKKKTQVTTENIKNDVKPPKGYVRAKEVKAIIQNPQFVRYKPPSIFCNAQCCCISLLILFTCFICLVAICLIYVFVNASFHIVCSNNINKRENSNLTISQNVDEFILTMAGSVEVKYHDKSDVELKIEKWGDSIFTKSINGNSFNFVVTKSWSYGWKLCVGIDVILLIPRTKTNISLKIDGAQYSLKKKHIIRDINFKALDLKTAYGGFEVNNVTTDSFNLSTVYSKNIFNEVKVTDTLIISKINNLYTDTIFNNSEFLSVTNFYDSYGKLDIINSNFKNDVNFQDAYYVVNFKNVNISGSELEINAIYGKHNLENVNTKNIIFKQKYEISRFKNIYFDDLQIENSYSTINLEDSVSNGKIDIIGSYSTYNFKNIAKKTLNFTTFNIDGDYDNYNFENLDYFDYDIKGTYSRYIINMKESNFPINEKIRIEWIGVYAVFSIEDNVSKISLDIDSITRKVGYINQSGNDNGHYIKFTNTNYGIVKFYLDS